MCLVLCFPVSFLSTSATSVDGNTVYTYWYIDNVEDLELFENTIVSYSKPYTFHINATIILNEPIPSNTLFDLDIGLQFDSYADPSVEVQFVEPGYKVVGNAVVDIVNDHITINSLQFDYDISRLYLEFYVTYPEWTTIQTVYDFTIDGVTYECEKNQTWDAWTRSSFNTLGLISRDGKIWYENGDILKELYTGDTLVNNYDLVDKDKSYYLRDYVPPVTYIQFYIGNNSCTAVEGMTWEAWVNSEYNILSLIIDGDNIYSSDKSTILQSGGVDIGKTTTIVSGAHYSLSSYVNEISFAINNMQYYAIEGMTFEEWCSSPYNSLGLYCDYYDSSEEDYYVYLDGEILYDEFEERVYADSVIGSFDLYYTNSYAPWSLFSRYQYEFDFSITSVSVNVQDEQGLLNGVVSWLKKLVDSVKELPAKIGDYIADKIRGLFVPSEEDLLEIIDKFELLLKERFGIAYDANKIIDDLAMSFTYTESKTSVEFPTVTVNLAGTSFSFGGWQVKLIPDGFEGLADSLKFIVNIVCTLGFVMAICKRWEEVLIL